MVMTVARPGPGGAPARDTGATASTIVVDTSVLLADPESIFSFGAAEVVIPLRVIEELDNQKSRLDEVGRAARTVARTLEELRSLSADQDLRNPVVLPGGGTLRVVINGHKLEKIERLGLDVTKSDNRILAAALGLAEDRPVRLVSADVNLRLKAAALGLQAHEYLQTRPGFHTEGRPGWREVEVEGDLLSTVYDRHFVSFDTMTPGDAELLSALMVNEFGVLVAGRSSALVRRYRDGVRLLRSDHEAWGLRPRSKEQRFALDLLLDPDVPICGLSGRAGTGKTALAIAAGLEQVLERPQRYDRLMILRPMYPVGRQEIGFLPGQLKEKLEPWFSMVEDTMTALRDDRSRVEARKDLEMLVERGHIDMQPVTYLRGRSLQRTFIICDEMQSAEALVLKTILTRLGEGSKVVFVGDVTQIDNPFVSERTSAISILADRFSGQALFGHLVLTKGERSPVADLATELL